jgi:uncharacterized protein (TIGR02808 family)
MSMLESVFWHILGYAAIPLIFVAGILISSLCFYFFVRVFVRGGGD